MIDPNTMTLDQLRDWLAERKGWRTDKNTPGVQWWHHRDNHSTTYHPIPATRDAAAGAMPEGWWWRRYPLPCTNVIWEAGKESDPLAKVLDTADEITDRFRLSALCILAEESHNAK